MKLVDIFNQKKNINDLKNSMTNKKGAIFLCGQNLIEHKEKFSKVIDNKNFITLAYKNSSNILPSEPDILFIDTRIKDTNVPSKNVLIVYNNDGSPRLYKTIHRNNEFAPHIFINSQSSRDNIGVDYIGYGKYKNYIFDQFVNSNTITNKKTTDNYSQCLMFMYFLGIKEIYIFGAYNIEHPDIRKFRFSHHFNNMSLRGGYVIETGHMMHALSSHWWYTYLKNKGVCVFNVSKEGSLCERIPRIIFNDIFKEKKKNISNSGPDCCLFSFIQRRLDIDYYSKTHLKKEQRNFDACLTHYIWKGYFGGCMLNKTDNHSMVNICKPVHDVVVNKLYDNEIIFLLVLFKYPTIAIQHGLYKCEFPFQNHVLSPSIVGRVQYRHLPTTYKNCDKLITKIKFDYNKYYNNIQDSQIIGKHPQFKMSFGEIKRQVLTSISHKYIALCAYLISEENRIYK